MKSIKEYILTSTLITAFLVLVGVYLFTSYSHSKMLQEYAEKTSRITLDQTFNYLFNAMERGASREELSSIIRSVSQLSLQNNMQVDIYRSESLSKEFGFIDQEPDELVSSVLATGVKKYEKNDNNYITALPVIAESRCLFCHTTSSAGDVLGVIKTNQNLKTITEEMHSRTHLMIFCIILLIPILIGFVISTIVSRRIRRTFSGIHSAIINIKSVDDLTHIEFEKKDLQLKEVSVINDEMKDLAKKLRSISTDNDTLSLQIQLMQKLVITADTINDWVDFTKKLIVSINEVVECPVIFAIFKTENNYELSIFWYLNPGTETKMVYEDSILNLEGVKDILNGSFPSIKHYVSIVCVDLQNSTPQLIQESTKYLLFPDKRIGNITAIGIQTPYSNDKSKSIVFDSVMSTLTNVLGSAKAIHLYTKDIEFLATRDPLTNLHNQRMFWDLLKSETKRAERHKFCFSLVVLDFDNFKLINDVYGHAFGDKLIQRFAERLRNTCREEDVIARYGGDEFTIILPESNEESAYSMVQRLKENLNAVNILAPDGKNIKITTSIGVASYPHHADEDKKLFLVASNMMYKAKREGKNRICVPRGEDFINSFKETGVKGQIILNAIETNSLIPYFQPIMSLADNSVSVHELLMRISVNGRIMVAGEFINEAESMGVIHIMDMMLIAKAFEIISTTGYDGYLFINLSPKSLMIEEFVEEILKLVTKYNINKTKIVFEITERDTVRNISLLSNFISKLKKEGFLFAIDDFGSGFSSFHYIKMFPIDFIKIEGEFIKNILSDDIDKAFVKSALTLADELKIKTVAEFVENGDVLTALEELGVDYAQGYYIDKPSSYLLKNNTIKFFS
jgi:diguanylate cyclase (GGDEF)-like protein